MQKGVSGVASITKAGLSRVEDLARYGDSKGLTVSLQVEQIDETPLGRAATGMAAKPLPEQERDQQIEAIIDNLFHTREHQLPRSAITELNKLSYPDITRDFYKPYGIGENLLAKEHNKYMFRLLQIFGFRNESMLSLVDKDLMKVRYAKAWNGDKYPRDTFLE